MISAQTNDLSLERAIEIALQNNIELNTSKLRVDQAKSLKPTAFSIDKTEFFYGYDQNNMGENGHPLNIVGVEQSFNFPTVYTSQYKVNKTAVSLSEKELENRKIVLMKDVSKAYYEIGYLMNKEYYYRYLDTLYQNLTNEVERKYKNGGATNLELLNVKAKHQQIVLSITNLTHDRAIAIRKLMVLMNISSPVNIPRMEPVELMVKNMPIRSTSGFQYKELETQIHKNILNVEKNLLLPDITLSYYNGTNKYPGSKNYSGFQVGLSIPLFFSAQRSKIESGKIAVSISKNEEDKYLLNLKLRREELMSEVRKLRESLSYFTTTGKKLGAEIVSSAKEGYESQEIDLFEYVQSIENAMIIEVEYLDWLAKYNNVVLELNYLDIQL